MPGILPMKMIRVGNTPQSRIAQACDRCRSKKIRCDGVRPCCTQCANVGFECKTSDKLSRRAFPRGYTESLEDRVRGLEAEVRELKDLLDEKDEKIDMLSRIHNFSPPSRKCSASLSPATAAEVKAEVESAREEVLHVEIPAPVQPKASSTGSSTTSAFVEAFEQKAQESGKQSASISSSTLVSAIQAPRQIMTGPSKLPPRIVSDQYINLFFQEWQPVMPILHRPTFLRVYEQYISNPEEGSWRSNKHAVAQLFLIFEIAALSSMTQSHKSMPSYEGQWRKALYSTSSGASLPTLQCHVLAQLCYLLRADYTRLSRHRGVAVGMCHELGLHQGHKYHTLPPFEAETRKKVFWCQYVLDKFTSAAVGTPMLLRDVDISTEYPADVDDENISVQGISPSLPGELTKISSALALFRVSRTLSKTLEHLYPAQASYQLSLSKLHALSDELDQWSEELPDHLRLRFCNDKPATNMISCRSPILSLAYFYTRSLVHRPLLCHGSGSAASAANIVLAAAGKHMLQILDLLRERSMNYTFPFNKTELLLSSGFSILWQSIDLEEDSKVVKDNQRSLALLIDMLRLENPVAATELQKLAVPFVTSDGRPASTPKMADGDGSRTRLTGSMPAPTDTKSKSTRKQLQAIASRFSSFSNRMKPDDPPRRATVAQTSIGPALSPSHRAASTVSLSSTRSAPVLPISSSSPHQVTPARTIDVASHDVNLDYFPLGGDDTSEMQTRTSSSTMLPPRKQYTPSIADASWENLLTHLEANNPSTLYPEMSSSGGPNTLTAPGNIWTQEAWPLSAIDLSTKAPVPQSLLSFSEESLTSGDDFLFSTTGSNNGSTAANESLEIGETYRGITIPIDDHFDFQEIEA